ncbi:hypothetical protein JW921_02760, partial [Candidatus Fermentibacterales bacterium]|nr:hypothetical protein [Candidatus Fermentibacterales bacterium]
CVSRDAACGVVLGWVDSSSVADSVTICDSLPAGEWLETGPFDLSGDWSGRTIDSLWLRFEYDGGMLDRPVRIGWVRLEEE